MGPISRENRSSRSMELIPEPKQDPHTRAITGTADQRATRMNGVDFIAITIKEKQSKNQQARPRRGGPVDVENRGCVIVYYGEYKLKGYRQCVH
jgi:hypothetical protein